MRALLIVLDSVGVGGAADAGDYGDSGADTLGHLLERFPDLSLPALGSLGLWRIMNRPGAGAVSAAYGRMSEASCGKDSMTGHWEIAGAIVRNPLGLFERFPPDLVEAIEREAQVHFIGNCAASGTQIIEDLGAEHLRSGDAILYTSADSVLQIAAHEQVIPLQRLYAICRIARRHADRWRIGRVIARPFAGVPGALVRTAGRHDFSLQPPTTVLNALTDAGQAVIGIGKTADLFGGCGITASHPTTCNAEGMSCIERVWAGTKSGLVFANLVDFDTLYGHRRDPAGYARALVAFDQWLGAFLTQWRPEDLLIITADHGNDPTYHGTDHTREQVPVMLRYGNRRGNVGTRTTFADVAATLAEAFGLQWAEGTSILRNRRGRSDHGRGAAGESAKTRDAAAIKKARNESGPVRSW